MNIYVATAVGIALLCVIGLRIALGNAPQNRPDQILRPVLERIYGASPTRPALKVSWSYGFPSFEVIFASKVDFESATDQNRELKKEIGRLFVRHGVIGRPFDPDLATFFNYPGRFQELSHKQRVVSSDAESTRNVL